MSVNFWISRLFLNLNKQQTRISELPSSASTVYIRRNTDIRTRKHQEANVRVTQDLIQLNRNHAPQCKLQRSPPFPSSHRILTKTQVTNLLPILLLTILSITGTFALPASFPTDTIAHDNEVSDDRVNTPHHMICVIATWESECYVRYHSICERGHFSNLGMQKTICDRDECSCVENRKRDIFDIFGFEDDLEERDEGELEAREGIDYVLEVDEKLEERDDDDSVWGVDLNFEERDDDDGEFGFESRASFAQRFGLEERDVAAHEAHYSEPYEVNYPILEKREDPVTIDDVHNWIEEYMRTSEAVVSEDGSDGLTMKEEFDAWVEERMRDAGAVVSEDGRTFTLVPEFYEV